MTKVRIKSPLLQMLGIDYPIVQGGLGPFSTRNLAAAISNAGALGTVSMPHSSSPEEAAQKILEHIHTVQRNTDKHFAVNTPIGSHKASSDRVLDSSAAAIEAVCKEREKDPDLRERLVLYITSGGDPSTHHQMIKDAGLIHFHMIGAVRHGKKAEDLGMDGVMASGYEMGGHTHIADRTAHTMVLVPNVVQALKIPVLASGGICDAATLAAALALGAVGVQMGTRFIATKECEFHENYKKAIVDAQEWGTVVIPSMLGPGRHLRTPFTYEVIEMQEKVNRGEMDLTEKIQKVMDAQALSEDVGDIERGLLLAGMGSQRINSLLTVQEVIDSMVEGAAQIIRKLNSDLIEG
ncbi:NAD(P)H-dependent flavin oxidoreductase [Chloroflexota bacterium]